MKQTSLSSWHGIDGSYYFFHPIQSIRQIVKVLNKSTRKISRVIKINSIETGNRVQFKKVLFKSIIA
jgi:hypothetical protein